MSYYFALPLLLALLPSLTNAGAFDHEKCFDEHHNEISCPSKTDTQKIVAIAVPLGILALLIAGFSIFYYVKKRRAKTAFVNLDAPAASVPPYNVGAPRMEQGYAGQWAPPPQYNPDPSQRTQPYAPPPGLPSDMAPGGSYNTGEPEKHAF